ncbi:hypothetical protein Drorol1_Dr00006578 [Drosera rotundifolia]
MAPLVSPINSFKVPQNKVIFVLGATGTGKSKLSIDLAYHFHSEIINADKIQVYKGLDIVTNKVTKQEQLAVHHHLLGHITDHKADYTSKDFVVDVLKAINTIIKSGKLPIIAGGSNSYIEELVQDPAFGFESRYKTCFLWLDVDKSVLHSAVEKRVDEMVRAGLVEEVRKMFEPDSDYTKGIRRAIGMQEFDSKLMHRYLREENNLDEAEKAEALEIAISKTKENTCKLSTKQVGKIHRFKDELGWDLNRIDATPVFEKSGKKAIKEWNNTVMLPCLRIVQEFLKESIDKKISIINEATNRP